jgi:hypothetical protein
MNWDEAVKKVTQLNLLLSALHKSEYVLSFEVIPTKRRNDGYTFATYVEVESKAFGPGQHPGDFTPCGDELLKVTSFLEFCRIGKTSEMISHGDHSERSGYGRAPNEFRRKEKYRITLSHPEDIDRLLGAFEALGGARESSKEASTRRR